MWNNFKKVINVFAILGGFVLLSRIFFGEITIIDKLLITVTIIHLIGNWLIKIFENE